MNTGKLQERKVIDDKKIRPTFPCKFITRAGKKMHAQYNRLNVKGQVTSVFTNFRAILTFSVSSVSSVYLRAQ